MPETPYWLALCIFAAIVISGSLVALGTGVAAFAGIIGEGNAAVTPKIMLCFWGASGVAYGVKQFRVGLREKSLPDNQTNCSEQAGKIS